MTLRQGDGTLHLETSTLHLELSAALKEDVSRKKTDEMKKRAIHTAASYDEFRHMVSCAQLNPVTRKEMEMLSDPKRGWQGRVGGVAPTTKVSGSTGRQNAPRRTKRCVDTAISGGAKAGPLRAPKDHAQFQRDWRRRCRTNCERRDYLRLIGPENVSALFRVEMEPDVLGQVLSVVCQECPLQPQRIDTASPAAPEEEEARSGAPTKGDAAGMHRAAETANGNASGDEAGARFYMEWLWALSRTGRFAVNILFLADKEKVALARVFDLMSAVFGDEDGEEISSLRKSYAV
ncbi:unnamed protein product [Ectocarpus fasciculatus]